MTDAALSLSNSLVVDVQLALDHRGLQTLDELPSSEQFVSWANAAYLAIAKAELNRPIVAEITIRVVNLDEIIQLNRDYRQQDKATNVLSFPFEAFPYGELKALEVELLGDVIICHPVIVREAQEQHKTVFDHYAHMVTHGVLHLLGYDHQERVAAEQMEALEVGILAEHNISDPYKTSKP